MQSLLDVPGLEIAIGFDTRGFLSTSVELSGWSTMLEIYDEQRFLITPAMAPNLALSKTTSPNTMKWLAPTFNGALHGKFVNTGTCKPVARRATSHVLAKPCHCRFSCNRTEIAVVGDESALEPNRVHMALLVFRDQART